MQVVDSYTWMGFCCFLKSRDQIAGGLETLLNKFKVYKHSTKYIRCDNAGENKSHVQTVMLEHRIQPEFISTDTPQYKGVAERHIIILKLCRMAMMNAAGLNLVTHNVLWQSS